MKKVEIGKLCNLSRQTIYNLMADGLKEFDILSRYTRPLKENEIICVDTSIKVHEQEIFKKGFFDGYKKAVRELKIQRLEQKHPANKKLQDVCKITRRIIQKYQNSNIKEIEFSDINDIYEIVKDEDSDK